MKRKIIILLIPFLLLFLHYPFAQNTGRIRFALYPRETRIKVDDSKLINNADTMVTLNEGRHNFKIWAPKMNLLDTNLTINKDSLLVFRYILNYDKAYVDYLRSFNRYKFKRFNRIVLPALGIAGISAGAFILKKKSDDYHDQAIADIDRYEKTIAGTDQFLQIKKDLENHREKYKLFKGLSYGTASVAAAATVFYILSLKKLRSLEKPVYKENNLLSRMDLGIDYGTPENNLVLNFLYKF